MLSLAKARRRRAASRPNCEQRKKPTEANASVGKVIIAICAATAGN